MESGARLAKLAQDIRASYWFLPSSLVIFSVLLSFLTLYIDRHADTLPFVLPEYVRETQAQGARLLVSTIAQSSFGVAGVMFSITMVAVSFASGNFGPRLIGNFMRDRGNQWSLGILIATFAYALLVTRAIHDPGGTVGDKAAFVPYISVLMSVLLMFVSVATVIYFVHHVPETINVSNITADLGERLGTSIRELIDARCDAPPESSSSLPERPPEHEIRLDETGYIQTMNKRRLTALAEENDLLIELNFEVGSFVTPEEPALRLWGPPVDEDTAEEMRGCFAIGHSRTEYQNLLFLVDELLEMAIRALSPGVNDAFTAVNCLNWLYAAQLIAGSYRGGLVAQPGGRIHMREVTYETLLEASFGAALPYARPDPICHEHLARLLERLEQETPAGDHRETLRRFRQKIDLS